MSGSPAGGADEAQHRGRRLEAGRVAAGERAGRAGPAVLGAGQADGLDAAGAVATSVGEVCDEAARAGGARRGRAAVALGPAGGEARDRALAVGLLAVVGDDGVGGAVDVEERRAGGRRA